MVVQPMRWMALVASLSMMAVGCRIADMGTSSSFTVLPPDPIPGYAKWSRLTPAPVRMDPLTAALCVAPENPSPHTGRYAHVYVNELAKTEAKRVVEALERGEKPKNVAFPPGSIFVKSKLNSPKNPTATLVTIMEKLEAGASPKSADWRFSIRDGKGVKKLEDKQPSRCYSCHASMPADKVSFAYIGKR